MAKGLAKISICVPIKKKYSLVQVILFPESWKHLKEKTTVIGDYSHIKRDTTRTLEFVKKLTPDPIISHIEIYSMGKTEAKTHLNG
jgi:hypothetical protein